MFVSSSNRRVFLRLMLVIIAVAVGCGRAAIASEITAPIEQLHAGLISIMKAGKTASRRYTIASYVANFDTYSGQLFDTGPAVRAVGNDRVVETRIASPGGRVHALDYVMRQEDGGWKVIDVLAEGSISRVASQRSEMRSLLADGGGSELLVSLRQKTAELSGGILQ